MYRILSGDIESFCRHYDGEPFHALLCDAPYHLQSIVDRFGKTSMEDDTVTSEKARGGVDSYSRLSRGGFMGAEWDGGDIAFRKETWAGMKELLFPGAFGMTFGGSRTAHRMAVAIEDAGFIIHPMMGWTYGSGFPKATRVKGEEAFEGHRYGTQALKPALEPIIVFQKPFEGKPVENIVENGAGALNIEGGRIGSDKVISNVWDDNAHPFGEGAGNTYTPEENKGRWPANFVLSHSLECTNLKCGDLCSAKLLDEQSGHLKSGTGAVKKASSAGYQASAYGKESREEGTPNIEYGDEGGASRFFHNSSWAFEQADPFIYQAKVSVSERNAGLINMEEQSFGQSNMAKAEIKRGKEETNNRELGLNQIKKVRNPHPTLKPIALTAHLATLLLPPAEYAPRRILVPFAGVGSEMIGAFQAGWDIAIGVELEKEYVEIGAQRINYWLSQGVQLDLI